MYQCFKVVNLSGGSLVTNRVLNELHTLEKRLDTMNFVKQVERYPTEKQAHVEIKISRRC